MSILSKANNIIIKIEDYVNGILLLSSTIILFINVLLRYVFHDSSTWIEEIVRYSMVWITFFGGSICVRNKLHVGIDIIVMIVPQVLKKVLTALAQFLAAIFTAFITYYGFQTTVMVIETSQKSPAMMLPMWIVYLAIPVGSALMTIRFLMLAWEVITSKDEIEPQIVDEKGEVDLSRL